MELNPLFCSEIPSGKGGGLHIRTQNFLKDLKLGSIHRRVSDSAMAMSKMPHCSVVPPGLLFQGLGQRGEYRLGQKKLREISFVYPITSCLRSRQTACCGTRGGCDRCPGNTPPSSPRVSPASVHSRATLGWLAQISSAPCPTAPPSGKSEYEAKEVPGPSLPASFPPPAGSFPPH